MLRIFFRVLGKLAGGGDNKALTVVVLVDSGGPEMTNADQQSVWARFWRAGGWWRSLLLVVLYYGLYQGLALLVVGPIAARAGDDPVVTVWVDYALPIALGGVLLLVFGWSTGLLRELFSAQPVPGRPWMWIGALVPAVFVVLHFASVDYAAAGAALVLSWLVTGLCIGFAEEVLTRGFVVNLMRRAGHGELAVATVSAALFAAMHAGNLLSGQNLFATAIQVGYTFAFGILMYLTLRVTGHLIWPILLHAATDPSTFLQSEFPVTGGLTQFAGLGNLFVIAAGLVLLVFIRGRAQPEFSGSRPVSDREPA